MTITLKICLGCLAIGVSVTSFAFGALYVRNYTGVALVCNIRLDDQHLPPIQQVAKTLAPNKGITVPTVNLPDFSKLIMRCTRADNHFQYWNTFPMGADVFQVLYSGGLVNVPPQQDTRSVIDLKSFSECNDFMKGSYAAWIGPESGGVTLARAPVDMFFVNN